MKKRFLLPALLSAALILSALNRLSAAVPPEDLAAIDARAAELAALAICVFYYRKCDREMLSRL